MKPSHTTTPRSLNECVFMLDADPIDRPESHRRPMWPLWVAAAIVVATFAMVATPARATGVQQPPPASSEHSATSTSGALAGAAAGAVSGAVATSTGGASDASAVGTGGDARAASGGNSLQGGSTRTTVAVLPQPVWTMVPQASGCIVTSARSLSGGWSFLSGARSDQFSDPVCAGIILAKAAYDHCHFESEQMIMQRVYATLFPGVAALPTVPGVRNMTLAECEEIKRPRLTLSPVMHTPPAAAVTVPERAAKPDRQ